MSNRPLVSVFCTAYNHERYIADALESFIAQETNFKFEVLVHDDASTDGTAKIIQKFEEAHPGFFRCVYQKENQYSKGVAICSGILLPMAKGKYIALCEGDDYWTDPHKLQRQVDYMEGHPECPMCTHQVQKISESGKECLGYCTPCDDERDFDTGEVILGGGGLFGTNSLLYRLTNAVGYQAWKPDSCPIGDYPTAIYHSTFGPVHYFPEAMSAYRIGAVGSWSSRLSSAGGDAISKHTLAVNEMLEQINERTGRKYELAIRVHQKDNLFSDAVRRGDVVFFLRQPEMRSMLADAGFKQIAKLCLNWIMGAFRKKAA